jgi:hypothetical protein
MFLAGWGHAQNVIDKVLLGVWPARKCVDACDGACDGCVTDATSGDSVRRPCPWQPKGLALGLGTRQLALEMGDSGQ